MKTSVKDMPSAIPRSGFLVTEFVLPCKYTDKTQIYKREVALNFKTASKMLWQHEFRSLLEF
jgi:hypothetical protein